MKQRNDDSRIERRELIRLAYEVLFPSQVTTKSSIESITEADLRVFLSVVSSA